MRKVSLAIVVLATTLVFVPTSALCDSFGYRTSGSSFGINTGSEPDHANVPNGIAESGIFSNKEIPGSGGFPNSGAFGSNPVDRPVDGAYLFDNLLNVGSKGSGGAVVDLSGQQMVLFTGNNVGSPGAGGASSQFYFADKGTYRVSNEFQKGSGTVRSNTTALTVTPEPGSLFLLGTGLLGLALGLFWKAAKRSTGS